MPKRKFKNGDEVVLNSDAPNSIRDKYKNTPKLIISGYYGESRYRINGRTNYYDTVESRFLDLGKSKTDIDILRDTLSRKLAQINDLTKVVEEIQDKIQFAELNNLDKFDENQYKAYKMLTMIEDESLSKLEKAKLISDMIK